MTNDLRIVLLREHFANSIEALLPHGPLCIDPFGEQQKPMRLDAAVAHASLLLRSHETRTLQHPQMLRHGSQRNSHRLGEHARCERTSPAEVFHDGTPCWIAKRVE